MRAAAVALASVVVMGGSVGARGWSASAEPGLLPPVVVGEPTPRGLHLSEVAVGGDGTATLGWLTGTRSRRVQVATRAPGAAAFGPVHTLDPGGRWGPYAPSVAAAADGTAVAAWVAIAGDVRPGCRLGRHPTGGRDVLRPGSPADRSRPLPGSAAGRPQRCGPRGRGLVRTARRTRGRPRSGLEGLLDSSGSPQPAAGPGGAVVPRQLPRRGRRDQRTRRCARGLGRDRQALPVRRAVGVADCGIGRLRRDRPGGAGAGRAVDLRR